MKKLAWLVVVLALFFVTSQGEAQQIGTMCFGITPGTDYIEVAITLNGDTYELHGTYYAAAEMGKPTGSFTGSAVVDSGDVYVGGLIACQAGKCTGTAFSINATGTAFSINAKVSLSTLMGTINFTSLDAVATASSSVSQIICPIVLPVI